MKRNGFTLIELMIAVGIVAILASIAIPAYLQYTRTANRTDATRTLSIDAQALERCYSQQFAYTPCAGAPVGNAVSPQGYYSITIAVQGSPAAGFLISAKPLTQPQLADTSCATFTLDSTGKQAATSNGGAVNTATCWGST